MAIIDWFSRYVLSWVLSVTLDGQFCLEALEQAPGSGPGQALRQGRPEIFNTDQGVQFTSLAWTEQLKKGGIRISMDGRGRALEIYLWSDCGGASNTKRSTCTITRRWGRLAKGWRATSGSITRSGYIRHWATVPQ